MSDLFPPNSRAFHFVQAPRLLHKILPVLRFARNSITPKNKRLALFHEPLTGMKLSVATDLTSQQDLLILVFLQSDALLPALARLPVSP
jgi:hypothetical protein